MSPIEFIRKHVFKLSQKDFAAVAEVTQSTVSRWEAGVFAPTLKEMKNIRSAAKIQKINWDDRWFFEVPAEQTAQ